MSNFFFFFLVCGLDYLLLLEANEVIFLILHFRVVLMHVSIFSVRLLHSSFMTLLVFCNKLSGSFNGYLKQMVIVCIPSYTIEQMLTEYNLFLLVSGKCTSLSFIIYHSVNLCSIFILLFLFDFIE